MIYLCLYYDVFVSFRCCRHWCCRYRYATYFCITTYHIVIAISRSFAPGLAPVPWSLVPGPWSLVPGPLSLLPKSLLLVLLSLVALLFPCFVCLFVCLFVCFCSVVLVFVSAVLFTANIFHYYLFSTVKSLVPRRSWRHQQLWESNKTSFVIIRWELFPLLNISPQ